MTAVGALVWLLLLVPVAAQPASQYSVGTDGSVSPSNLFLASTWAELDGFSRAKLYTMAAADGLLGEELRRCAMLLVPSEFMYGSERVRGAAASPALAEATANHPLPSTFCSIGEKALISRTTVQLMLAEAWRDEPNVLQEIASLQSLVRNPADERSLIVVLLLREAGRASSPLMPYIQGLLHGAHENIPSAWDPASAIGAARRAALAQAPGGDRLLMAADALRKAVLESYASLVPRALEQVRHRPPNHTDCTCCCCSLPFPLPHGVFGSHDGAVTRAAAASSDGRHDKRGGCDLLRRAALCRDLAGHPLAQLR